VVCGKESADALQTQRPDVKQEIAMFQNTFAQADAVIVHDAAIAEAIDAAMLRRRDEYAGQPMAWKVFCEASHVATLCEPLRMAFINRVASERGADIALRLKTKAEAIRAAAIAELV
jgi:hypothetical protein